MEIPMKIAWTLCLSGALLARAADAQPHMDADGDGRVSAAEFETALVETAAARFAALDRDDDGYLSEDELRARLDRRRAGRGELLGRIAEIDADGDGAWSLAEVQAVRPEFDQERFARLDANGNGLLEADERPGRRRGLGGAERATDGR